MYIYKWLKFTWQQNIPSQDKLNQIHEGEGRMVIRQEGYD